jgi:GT2 family glycosyltransferase
MPHLTDALVKKLKSLITTDVQYVVLDNGSDKEKIASSTTHFRSPNRRLTGGMNWILEAAKGSDYVWLCTNDIDFTTNKDPVASMVAACEADKSIGCIHPSLVEPVPNYFFQFMINRGPTAVTTGHTVVDIICPFFTKRALDANGWEFDPRFEYGWGIDYDACLKVRQGGMTVAVDHSIIATHQTSVTYDSGADREFKGRQEYYAKAMDGMNKVMELKYGKEWRKLFF